MINDVNFLPVAIRNGDFIRKSEEIVLGFRFRYAVKTVINRDRQKTQEFSVMTMKKENY